jgi:uncharacterized repeat protein (TIGR03847 family)
VTRSIHAFEQPDRFVAGTVGVPGDRSFYLQARDGSRVVSVLLEKSQVAQLANKVDELLDMARRRGGDVPGVVPRTVEDTGPLDSPVDEEFRVGALALGWDPEREVVVIEALAQSEATEETVEAFTDIGEGPDALRVALSPLAARAFARRAERVVAAGRPPCMLCNQPLDPAGHQCPRLN